MSSRILANRVAFLTNAAGGDDLTVDLPIEGRRVPGDAFDDGAPVRYRVEDNNESGNWEEREGTYRTGPARIERGTFLDSNTGDPIVLSGGAGKKVFVDAGAALLGAESGRLKIATTAGTGAAFTIALPAPIGILEDGVEFTAIMHTDNSQSDCTIKPDSFTAKTIKAGMPRRKPAVGALKQGAAVTFRYDKANNVCVPVSGMVRTVKTVSTSTYTLLEEDHEQDLVFTNAAGCAITVPQSTGQFVAPYKIRYFSFGGAVTFTPTTSTVSTPNAAGAASFTAPAGSNGELWADGAGNYRANVDGGTSALAVIAEARDLWGWNDTATPNARLGYAFTEIVLKDASGAARLIASKVNFNQGKFSLDITLSGVNGLDTGAEAASTWYYAWMIDLTAPVTDAAVVANAGTDRITHNAHGFAANKAVMIGGTAAPGGLALGSIYFIRDVTTNDYKLALTPNGAAIDLTSTGTAVTITSVPDLMFSLNKAQPTMPAGYTFKALLGAWFNDGSSNLRRMQQIGRRTSFARIVCLSGSAPVTPGTFQSLSIAAAVPPIAIGCSGTMGTDQNGSAQPIAVAADANGTGVQQSGNNWNATNMDGLYFSTPFAVPIITAQTIYWTAASTSAESNIRVSAFKF